MEIKRDVVLAPYTTYNIGGVASFFGIAKEKNDILEAVEISKKRGLKLLIIGGGSNLLLSDNRFDGLVVLNRYKDLVISDENVKVGSGYILSLLILELLNNGLTGMENMYGIPGTIGGAIYQNAGAYGVEIKDFFISCDVIFNDGEIRSMNKQDMDFQYRKSSLKKLPCYILDVNLHLKKDDKANVQLKLDEIKSLRLKKPMGKSSGSYFKNPSKDVSAGKLIDEAGLKGIAVGDAFISFEHANYLINKNHAKCTDVLELAELIKIKVKEKYNIILEEEAEFIGNKIF